jgi:hypothetical protein
MIQAGRDLIQELDRHRFPAKTALWLYEEERDRWSLVIATPYFRAIGPLKSYRAVQKVLSKFEAPIELESVTLVDTKNRLIEGLSTPSRRRRVAASKLRLSHTFINGRAVDEAYIYRMTVARTPTKRVAKRLAPQKKSSPRSTKNL